MKKKALISTAIAGIGVEALCGFCYVSNTFELKQDTFTVEYGNALNISPYAYVDANEAILGETVMDLSKVDKDKVGEYPASATYKNKQLDFKVIVEDTEKPEISMQAEVRSVAGKELSGKDILIEATDKAGIKSISLKEGQIGEAAKIDDLKMKYDTPGTYENTITVEDNNGNKTEQNFTVKVVEDYEKHVSGIKDLTVEQDNTIDWLADIDKDEKIAEIQVDDSKVDMSKTGDYDLTYTIVGDDKETKIQKTIKVTVVSESKAQELANDGEVVKTTDGNKQKYVPPVQSSSGSGSSSGGSYSYSGSGSSSSSGGSGSYSGGGDYSGGSSAGGESYSGGGSSDSGSSSGSESSGGGSWLDSLTPGQTWDLTQTEEGYIDNYNGNTYEGGTFTP